MRRLLIGTLIATTTLTSGGATQDLSNHSFEDWTTTSPPPGWPQLANATTAQETAAGLVHCGDSSCKVTIAGTGWANFGKHWIPANQGALSVRARILLPSVPSGGSIKFTVAGFDSQWQLIGPSTSTVVTPSPHWQELAGTFDTTGVPGLNAIRVQFSAWNAPGTVFHVDSIDFAGTDPNYGELETAICYEVKSAKLSVLFDAKTGLLREIRDVDAAGLPVGANYLIPGGCWLYELAHRSSLNGTQMSSRSSDHGLFVAAAISQGSDVGFRVTASSGLPTGLQLMEVDILADPAKDDLTFVPLVTKTSPPSQSFLLEGIKCPVIEVASTFGSSATEAFVPGADGGLIPQSAWTNDPSLDWLKPYPGHVSMQFMAIYDTARGLAVTAHDDTGEDKTFRLRRLAAPDRLELSIRHNQPSIPEGTPARYPTVVHPCSRSWMMAAARYREWAKTAAWWTSENRAPWVLKRPTVLEANLRPQGIGKELVQIGRWPVVLNAWRNALRAPLSSSGGEMVALYRSFEKNGTFIGPDYTPLQVLQTGPSWPYAQLHPELTIKNAWSAAANDGHAGMAMIAGLKFATHRAGKTPACTGNTSHWTHDYTPVGPIPGLFGQVCVTDRSHVPQLFPQSPTNSWNPTHGIMCPTHAETIAVHTELAGELTAGGRIKLYLFDQFLGAGVPDCFNDAGHGHAPGKGRWEADAVKSLAQQTLAAVHGDAQLCIEGPSELVIPWITVQGTRPDHVLEWPAPQYPGSRLVPAFQFVYGSTVATNSWDLSLATTYTASQPATDDLRYNQLRLGRIMAAGTWMSVALLPWMLVGEYIANNPTTYCNITPTTQMEPMPDRLRSYHMGLLRHCVWTAQGPALAYLNDGEMQETQGFSAPSMVISPKINGTITQVLRPDALCTAWQLADGSIGLLVINTTRTGQPAVTLPTKIGDTTIAGNSPVAVYRNSFLDTSLTQFSAVQNITLTPQEVLFVVIP